MKNHNEELHHKIKEIIDHLPENDEPKFISDQIVHDLQALIDWKKNGGTNIHEFLENI